jgi:hypothetical protein
MPSLYYTVSEALLITKTERNIYCSTQDPHPHVESPTYYYISAAVFLENVNPLACLVLCNVQYCTSDITQREG